MSFDHKLNHKIQSLQDKIKASCAVKKDFLLQRSLGPFKLANPFIMAPLSGICHAPFRLLMQELGAAVTVSELISIHGIVYEGVKTIKMLGLFPEEKMSGIQLFGEDPHIFAKAAQRACGFNPSFIDINMGCPVKKVVTKGAGAALLQEPQKLGHFFSSIKKAITCPLTIKIRTGWDQESLNADEVVRIAKEEGIEWASIHGRTRSQGYEGFANWDYIETVACKKILPIVGNGDLDEVGKVLYRLNKTQCNALMLGRGPLRNPFLFLESLASFFEIPIIFGEPEDFKAVFLRYLELLERYDNSEHFILLHLKKFIVWSLSGLPNVASLREKIFTTEKVVHLLSLVGDYLDALVPSQKKDVDYSRPFMAGGHG